MNDKSPARAEVIFDQFSHLQEYHKKETRRTFLGQSVRGIGSLALASLLNPDLSEASIGATQLPKWKGVTNPTHFQPKAKRVIHLCMAGGPSHLETLDYKPKLAAMDGRPMPKSFTKGQPIAQLQNNKELKCLGPQYPFARHGQSGQMISTAFPHIGGIADDICIINSLQTEQINHDPAHTFFNT
ncbi:MAG: DUF1501 domain-containing protein, partial [Candidatus Poribacteria bacterium]|nr:DUF1501 domain-containing protein [Candidatus Poribacteria bacterium]